MAETERVDRSIEWSIIAAENGYLISVMDKYSTVYERYLITDTTNLNDIFSATVDKYLNYKQGEESDGVS